jgi:predicted ATPase
MVVKGRHGIGKATVVQCVANELGYEVNYFKYNKFYTVLPDNFFHTNSILYLLSPCY